MNDSMVNPESIAIVGMAGRFPGAKNVDQFWRNLRDGVESIRFFDEQELDPTLDRSLVHKPNFVPAKGILDNVEFFDAAFFGFNPREAAVLDPQHRVFLECCWEALEDAGYDPADYQGSIGVYAGTSMNSYLLNNILSNPQVIETVGGYQVMLGSDKDFLTTRVSYKLDLKGPSINIQTACSTSLVAIHSACQSLLDYQCDMALSGGVSILFPHKAGYLYQEGMILSPDGHCRAFDAAAEGTVGGEGVGVVVLKRLKDALTDGDHIHAVIRGTSINNDGSLKVGYTAPSVDGQAEAIALAQAMARVAPDTITYVEAHGTGTLLGDPIEIAALTQAFQRSSSRKGYCAIGSVKTNIGHLDAAAGVAGLIKTTLALENKQLPPSLYFKNPNPRTDFANSPFFVNAALTDWKANGSPRRAGVSSFGIGGTNAHAVLEEAPAPANSPSPRDYKLLLLSAKTETALETTTENLANVLDEKPEIDLADVAFTLQVGRRAFSYRRMVVCRNRQEALDFLKTGDSRHVRTNRVEQEQPSVVFMFPGQGAQHVDMAADLYRTEQTFRDELDRCVQLLEPLLGLDLREVIFSKEESDPRANHQPTEASERLQQTYLTQPALFAVEYALAKLWMQWGIKPHAMIGHSIGEYVAACLANVLTLEDALALVAERGRLIQAMPAGTMLVVGLPEKEVRPYLTMGLALAAVNAPSLCVISGPDETVNALQGVLGEKGVMCRPLLTSHAFHSEMMEAAVSPFVARVNQVKLNAPLIPFLSNVTGTWITAEQATDPAYWGKHLRQTVRFADGIKELLQDPNSVLLEVGPGRTLASLAQLQLANVRERRIFSSLPHPHDSTLDTASTLTALGELWLAGVKIDRAGFYASESRHRVSLPTYPFERQRCWIEPQKIQPSSGKRTTMPLKNPHMQDWFFVPSWKRSAAPELLQAPTAANRSTFLMFVDECGLGLEIEAQLKATGKNVIRVQAGDEFCQLSEHSYRINPHSANDYDALVGSLAALALVPDCIVHLWGVTQTRADSTWTGKIDELLDRGFYSLLYLAQSLGNKGIAKLIQIDIITNDTQQVNGQETLAPAKATVLGPCRVIPQEFPHLTCKSIDLVLPASSNGAQSTLAKQLVSELGVDASDPVIAYRGGFRWNWTLEPVQVAPTNNKTAKLRNNGVYLITGGLGGIGLVLAEFIAQTVNAHLVLVSRSPLPPKQEWEQWLVSHPDSDKTSVKIRKLQSLERSGSDIVMASADVANREAMRAVVNEARIRFGAIHGVIHAAGIAGGGLIQFKEPQTASRVLSAKVQGTCVLDELVQRDPLDFFVLCSSIHALMGGVGQADYSAANVFLDVFAQSRSAHSSSVVSVNWDTWQEVGMAVDTPVPASLQKIKDENLKHGITSEEGKEAFSRILGYPFTQVAVLTQGLPAAANSRAGRETPDAILEADSTVSTEPRVRESENTRPMPVQASSHFSAPKNGLEEKIASIWQDLLGIAQVGRNDDFFELGGHSLLAIQVVSRLRETFRIEIPLRSLFEAKTIAELAERLESVLLAPTAQTVTELDDDREELEI